MEKISDFISGPVKFFNDHLTILDTGKVDNQAFCDIRLRELGQLISDAINEKIEREKNPSQVSDGYHTFAELYEFRKVYNAALFNEWARQGLYEVHKSWRHHDGDWCFGGGWFIVVAVLPTGQISNHYEAKDWDLFKIPETIMAQYEFDGHTPKDVIERLSKL